jgi:hypothetical protein
MAEPRRAPKDGAFQQINIDENGVVTPANAIIADGGSIQFLAAAACSLVYIFPTVQPFDFPYSGEIPAGAPQPIIPATSKDITMNYCINMDGNICGPYSITVGDPATAPLPLQVVGASVLSQSPPAATIPAGGSIQYMNAPVACTAVFDSAAVFGQRSQDIDPGGAAKPLVAQPGQTDVTVYVSFTTPGKQSRSGKNTIKLGH